MVRLWHSKYGFLLMTEDATNQWTHAYNGERFGSFLTDYMGIVVHLPLSEVILDLP